MSSTSGPIDGHRRRKHFGSRRRDRTGLIERIDGALDVGTGVVVLAHPEPTHLVVHRGARLSIGHDVRIGHGVAISCDSTITIGDGTDVGPYTMIADSDFHVAGDATAHVEPRPVSIGRRVAIGPHTIVMPGADLGDDVTVLPGSVVSGHVEPGATISGNPAVVAVPTEHRNRRTVATIVADLLGLTEPPSPDTRIDDVPGWDSLGTLRVLFAIEAEYGTVVDERSIGSLTTVRDWEELGSWSSSGDAP